MNEEKPYVLTGSVDPKAVTHVNSITPAEVRFAHKRHPDGGMSGNLQQRWIYDETLGDGTRRMREEWRDIPWVTINVNEKGEEVR